MQVYNMKISAIAPLVIAGTGHRPEKLGGHTQAVEKRLLELATSALTRHHPTKVISGMALGWDMALAEASLLMGIPLVAAVPFEGQEKRWPESSRHRYQEILAQAETTHIVSPGGYSAQAMQWRNEWMVNRCDRLLALWDGSTGGTYNCIDYANHAHKTVLNIWKSWIKYR